MGFRRIWEHRQVQREEESQMEEEVLWEEGEGEERSLDIRAEWDDTGEEMVVERWGEVEDTKEVDLARKRKHTSRSFRVDRCKGCSLR